MRPGAGSLALAFGAAAGLSAQEASDAGGGVCCGWRGRCGGAADYQEAGREHWPVGGGGQQRAAQGNIAHQFVATAADGTVLLFGSVGPLTIAPHLMKLPYDPFRGHLAPVSGGVNFPNVLVVHKGAGVKTLAEFVQPSRRSRAAWNLPPPARARHRTWRASCSTNARAST